MATDGHRLAAERQRGSEQGEAFDRRLRARELADREERLSRLVWGADEPDLERDGGRERPTLGSVDLHGELDRLRRYYHAVQNSRAWRMTQRLRRVVGRAW